MKRTFIAVDIEPTHKLKEDYDLVRYRLRLERINWVPVNNLHITLSFLGDTDEELIPDVMHNLQDIVSELPLFDLTLRSFGVFKSLREPRVMWFGCDPCQQLTKIKNELDSRLSGLGFKPETNGFSPHMTLGRIKEIRQQNQLVQLITLFKDVVIQKQMIDKITVYESKHTPTGAVYVQLHVASLKK